MEAEADLLGFGMPEADFGIPEGAVLSVAAAGGGGGAVVATDVRGAGRLSLLLAGRVSFLGEGMELVEGEAAEEVRGAGMPLAGAEVRVSLRVGAGSALTATVIVAVAGGRLLGAAAACAVVVVVVVVGVAFEERWGEARDRLANVGEGIKLVEEEEEEEDTVRVVVAGVVLAGVAGVVVVREEVEIVAVGFAAVVFSGRRFSLLTARIAFAKSGVAACNTRSYSSSLRNAMPSAMSCGVRSSLSKMSTSSASRVRSSVKGMPNKLTRFLFWSISMASPSSRFVHTDSNSFAEGEVLWPGSTTAAGAGSTGFGSAAGTGAGAGAGTAAGVGAGVGGVEREARAISCGLLLFASSFAKQSPIP